MTTALPIKMSMLKSSLQQVKPLPLIPPESISFHQGSFLLGEGSFGTVKRGVWNGRAVAVKVVFQRIKKRNNRQFAGPGNLQQHKEPANDEANYQRMVQLLSNEARVMNEAQHPRIIALLGFIEQEASLVMEFMECGSLYEYIAKNGEIHWNQRFIFMADICEGMAFLHSKTGVDGVSKKPVLFHQDLKTDNVLLGFEKNTLRAKISDFGLATLRTYREKEYAASQLVTQKTTMTHRGGTRVYMAPELIRTKRFSRECDVFSMGVVLLEISTMLPPNQKLFDFEKEYMAKFGERGYLPTCLVNLIFDCLKLNNPSNRPSFAQIFSTLLQNQKTIQQCPITSRRQLLKTIDEIVVFLSSQRQASAMNPAASSVMTSAWFKAEDSGEASSESRGSKAAILGISTNGRKKGGDGLSGKAVGDDQYGDAGSNFISTGFTTNDDDNHTRGINFIRTKFKLKSKSRSMSDSAQAFVDTTSRHVKRNKIIAFNVVVIIALVIVLCVILIKPPGVSTSSSTFSNSTNSTIDNPSSNNNNSSSNNGTNTTTGNWAGANSFYLYALNDTDQDAVISHLKASNLKVVRVIMSSVPGGYLGSSAVYVPDLEESQVGVYQDTVLHLIDALLVKLLAADIKIIISMHDRFALGCYSEDSYAIISNITIGSSGNATCGDATSFYNTSIVIQAFDARIKHILSFKSEHFGGASWGSLGQVIYAFSIQNYAQFTDTSIQPTWWCDRAKAMRPLLSNGVKISTGPSNLATDTITDINMACGELDILSVSIYFLYASDVVDIFKAVNGSNKMVINEEFDSDGFGYKDRDGCINLVGGTSNNVSISWLVGNVFAMPGDRQGTEFSWSTDEKAWAALTAQAKNATGAAT